MDQGMAVERDSKGQSSNICIAFFCIKINFDTCHADNSPVTK